MANPGGVRPMVTAGGFAGFVLIGMLQALYGPAIPALRERFDLSAGAAGLALSAQFLGAVVGILGSGGLEGAGVSARARLVGSGLLLACGALGFALAQSWPLALLAALAAGLGFGGLDIGVNRLFATGYGGRSAAMLNLVNAAFGVGAVLGPLLVAAANGGYVVPFLVTAGLALLVIPLLASAPQPRPAPGGAKAPGIGALAAFVVLFFLYVGVETGAGGWEASHLVSLGVDPARAAGRTALFWGAITLGRLAAAPLSLVVPPERLVLGGLLLAVLGLGLAHLDPLAPVGYTLCGLGLAPVFPSGLVWLTRRLPGARAATALALASATVGGVVFVPFIGVLRDGLGPAVVPTVLAVLALCALAVAALLARPAGALGRRRDRHPEGS